MKISIIIPTLNEDKYIKKLLESIDKQYYTDHEIVVVDSSNDFKTKEAIGTNAKYYRTPKKNTSDGWLGIFNRNNEEKEVRVSKTELGLSESSPYALYSIWEKKNITEQETFEFGIPANGVVFIKYQQK